jgi:hypothetical protein
MRSTRIGEISFCPIGRPFFAFLSFSLASPFLVGIGRHSQASAQTPSSIPSSVERSNAQPLAYQLSYREFLRAARPFSAHNHQEGSLGNQPGFGRRARARLPPNITPLLSLRFPPRSRSEYGRITAHVT